MKQSANYRHKPDGLKWSKVLVKCLGIYIGVYSEDLTRKKLYGTKLKITSILQMWSGRVLTLKGKVTIIPNLVIPQLL